MALSALLVAGFLFMFFVNSRKIESIGGDQLVYNQLALNLLAGNGFSQCTVPPFLPSLIRTPAYPLFLAGIYALFGVENFEAVRLLQIILMLLSAGLVFYTAYSIFNSRSIAFISAAFNCFYGFDYYTGIGVYGYLFTEPLTLFLINGTLFSATLIIRKSQKKYFLLTGVFMALAMLTRPSNLLFPFFLGFFLFCSMPRIRLLKNILFMLFVVAVIIAPWTIRNCAGFNRLIILSTSLSGLNIFSGAIIKNPDFMPYPEADFDDNHVAIAENELKAAREALRGLYSVFNFGGTGGVEIYRYDDELKSIGLNIIQRNYFSFLEKWVYRILGHWHLGDIANIISGISRPAGIADWSKIVFKILPLCIFLFSLYYYRTNPLIYLLLLFPVYNTLIHTPFTPQLRYSLPAHGSIFILMAAGLYTLTASLFMRIYRIRPLRRARRAEVVS